MRTVVIAATVLGVSLFGAATTGIASLAGDLEAATPQYTVPAPATEELTYESREIDCPARERERPQI